MTRKRRINPIYTFGVSHSFVKLQLLSTHSVFDLINAICKHTQVWMCESVDDDHLWNVRVPGGDKFEAKCFNKFDKGTTLDTIGLTPGMELNFEYDNRSRSYYKIFFVEETELSNNEHEDDFPRMKEKLPPDGFTKFTPSIDINLNDAFSHLNKWVFANGRNVQVNFFQAGKSRTYGYLERVTNENVMQMIHLPAAPEKDLSQYLSCFDHGVKFIDQEYGYPFSLVVVPSDHYSSFLQNKYGKGEQPRWSDFSIAPKKKCISLNEVFPNIASLAGFRKDKVVKKGWMTYQDRTLTILSGVSAKISYQAYRSKYLYGTAFEGKNKHKPQSEDNIVCQMTLKVKSLQDLFCIAEGLLESIASEHHCLRKSKGRKKRRTA